MGWLEVGVWLLMPVLFVLLYGAWCYALSLLCSARFWDVFLFRDWW